MTQKELSYVEDAIGHENSIIKICQESVKMLDNDELISFLNEEIKIAVFLHSFFPYLKAKRAYSLLLMS